jgi:tetratricopeptide (TPR) repeat protein
MSRISDARLAGLSALVMVVVVATGCGQLDGRERNRKANRLYHDTLFADAAAQYIKALSEVDDPIIHYNLGLAYSRITHPGSEKPTLLDVEGNYACEMVPNTKKVQAQVCMREGDKHFAECDEKNTCPREFACEKHTFCALDAPTLADMSCNEFQAWLKAQPSDSEIHKELDQLEPERDKLRAKIDEAKATVAAEAAAKSAELEMIKDPKVKEEKKAELGSQMQARETALTGNLVAEEKQLSAKIDRLKTKFDTRALMSQLWMDTSQYPKAIGFWEDMLKAKADDRPSDAIVMGNIAGIYLRADDWRKSIEWYRKVATVSDTPNKIVAYQSIGNVAWQKLNSKKLSPADAVDLADQAIGALQEASRLDAKSAKTRSLQGSMYNFRALQQGASWAAALDRASSEDLKAIGSVLNKQANPTQGTPAPPPPPPPAPKPAGAADGTAPTSPKSGG